MEARSASGAELYRRLYESIKQGETFKPIDTMPSDVSVLIDHLRIDEADPLSVRWMQSAEQLLSDVGIVEAAQRLGGLPIALPKVFVTKLAALPPVERRLSLRTIRKIWLASPVGLVHLAQLWNELPHVGRHATKVRTGLHTRCAARVIDLCSKPGSPHCVGWTNSLGSTSRPARCLTDPFSARLESCRSHISNSAVAAVFRLSGSRTCFTEVIRRDAGTCFSRRGIQ